MAVTTALVVSAGAAVKGTIDAKKAAQRAGRAQAGAAGEGQEIVRSQFDLTQQDFRPTIEAGGQALQQQQALLGLSGSEAQSSAFGNIQESPGQRFIRKRQERSLLRNAAAIGGLGGGNVRTALQEQAAGFASQDIDKQFGRLQTLSGGGQQAASNLGQFGAGAAANRANLGVTGGQAKASGILGAQEAKAAGLGQLAQIGGQFAGGGAFGSGLQKVFGG